MARFSSTGYYETQGPYGSVRGETFTCAHCNCVVEIQPREAPAMCHMEWKPVCAACHSRGTCTPFEKRLERYEAKARFRRDLGVE